MKKLSKLMAIGRREEVMKTIFLLPCLIAMASCSKKSADKAVGEVASGALTSIVNSAVEGLVQGQGRILCPDGFIVAPALEGYTEKDFCVAKYEMKNTGGPAVSSPLERPWTNINRLEAQEKCREMGEGYDLISNGQWQTLARNVEMVKSNWEKSSLFQDGHLAHGHSDASPAITLPASSDDENGLFETGNTFEEGNSWHSQRRTLTLTNGEVIWDLAGNAWEWARDDNDRSYGRDMPIAKFSAEGFSSTSNLKSSPRDGQDSPIAKFATQSSTLVLENSTKSKRDAPIAKTASAVHSDTLALENSTKSKRDAPIAKTALAVHSDGLANSTVPASSTPKELFGPIGDYSSGSYGGLGIAYLSHSGGAIRRGSSWNARWGGPGVFSVALIAGPKSRSRTVGFRCVYHPR